MSECVSLHKKSDCVCAEGICCYSVGKPYFVCINSKEDLTVYYHHAELIHKQVEKYGSRTVLKYRDNSGKWLKISSKVISEYVRLLQKVRQSLG